MSEQRYYPGGFASEPSPDSSSEHVGDLPRSLDVPTPCRECKAMLSNLTSMQERCGKLLEETRAQRAKIHNFDEIAESFERNMSALKAELGAALVERDEAIVQRDAFGQKAHQLQERVLEMERAEGGILLPGWTCSACKAFNGSAKVTLTHCRCCGVARAV